MVYFRAEDLAIVEISLSTINTSRCGFSFTSSSRKPEAANSSGSALFNARKYTKDVRLFIIPSKWNWVWIKIALSVSAENVVRRCFGNWPGEFCKEAGWQVDKQWFLLICLAREMRLDVDEELRTKSEVSYFYSPILKLILCWAVVVVCSNQQQQRQVIGRVRSIFVSLEAQTRRPRRRPISSTTADASPFPSPVDYNKRERERCSLNNSIERPASSIDVLWWASWRRRLCLSSAGWTKKSRSPSSSRIVHTKALLFWRQPTR